MKDLKSVFDFQIRICFDTENMTNDGLHVHVVERILSVAVVEFGRHTPHYWSETYHSWSVYGVLKNLSYFNCFWSNIVKFSGDTVVGYPCW